MFVLHGVFGLGTNFRAVARALADARPDWGFVLVDLRGHGDSQGLPPPHDLEAAAADLDALAAGLGLPVRGVMGHSFGGKVALAFLARQRAPLDVGVVLDSMPGTRPMLPGEQAVTVLGVLESLPESLPSRDAFKEALRARGFAPAIVDWLAMNVRRDPHDPERQRLRLDLPAIRALLADYYARDLWSVVASPDSAAALGVVVAGRSPVFDAAARAQLAQAATTNARLSIHEIPAAGHWLHVDAPRETIGAVRAVLDRQSR